MLNSNVIINRHSLAVRIFGVTKCSRYYYYGNSLFVIKVGLLINILASIDYLKQLKLGRSIIVDLIKVVTAGRYKINYSTTLRLLL